MLTEICGYLRNYFVQSKYFGKFEISGGTISLPDFLKEGQYFRIIGSTFNDGIYQYPTYDLTDETFDGAIWSMAVPPSIIALNAEIKKFQDENPANSYTSESFGGYSYTRATGKNGGQLTWQEAFANKLKAWRKM